MRNSLLAAGFAFALATTWGVPAESGSIVWAMDRLTSLGGHKTEVLGEPRVVSDDTGHAIQFDGINDALIVENNPLAGATEFTIEVIFRPSASDNPAHFEQRFVHLQASEDHRALIELRLTKDNRWFLDTFIKSGDSSRVLFAEGFPHPVGPWYHAALVYKNGEMRHYVNGELELTGAVDCAPFTGGQTSVGMRLNRRSWFKGAIQELRVTPQALPPAKFSLGPLVSPAAR